MSHWFITLSVQNPFGIDRKAWQTTDRIDREKPPHSPNSPAQLKAPPEVEGFNPASGVSA